MLEEHPQVFIPPGLKEVHFFDAFYQDREKNTEKRRWNFEKGKEWYEAVFEGAAPTKLAGEITPNYLYDADAPLLIREMYPDIKIIVSLRNPVDRAISHYKLTQLNRPDVVNMDIEDAFDQLEDKFGFLEYGRYSKYLIKYLDIFPPDQIHLIDYQDIEKDPQKVCYELYAFLGVDKTFIPPTLKERVNSSQPKRLKTLYELMLKSKEKIKKNRMLANIVTTLGFVTIFRQINKLNTSKGRKEGNYAGIRTKLSKIYEEELAYINGLLRKV